MDALLHWPWSAAIGLLVLAAWILMLCAIFFPGRNAGSRDREGDGF